MENSLNLDNKNINKLNKDDKKNLNNGNCQKFDGRKIDHKQNKKSNQKNWLQ